MNKTLFKKHVSRAKKIYLVAIITLSSVVTSAFTQAEPEVNCTIPLAVKCEVTDKEGFVSVRVNVDFGPELGDIDVVTQNFSQCQYSTNVSWDPIVPNFQILTTPCADKGGEFKYIGKGKSLKTPRLHTKSFSILPDRDGYPTKIDAYSPNTKPFTGRDIRKDIDPIQHGLYEKDCTWTNDDQAACLVWDCEADGVCVELGQYCQDKYGDQVPCAN